MWIGQENGMHMCVKLNICVCAQSIAACTNKNYRFGIFQLLFHWKWLMNDFLFLLGNIFYFRVFTVFQTAQNIQFLLVEQVEQAIMLECSASSSSPGFS